MEKPSYLDFDKSKYHWRSDVDYRARPEAYRGGKGELVPRWRFKTPAVARASSKAIYTLFLAYLREGDFVGADMARKFLQMGFTRARRYANYRGGRKYDPATKQPLEKGTGDPAKAESARIFYEAWQKAEAKPAYAKQKAAWKGRYG
jgi:hypothetical protein